MTVYARLVIRCEACRDVAVLEHELLALEGDLEVIARDLRPRLRPQGWTFVPDLDGHLTDFCPECSGARRAMFDGLAAYQRMRAFVKALLEEGEGRA